MYRTRLIWCCAAAPAALLISLAGSFAVAEEPLPPLHKLTGVVVSKQDGRPLAGVEVAMAHAERGTLVFIGGGRLRAFGQDETVLWFFPKRNGRVKIESKTDAEGHFVLEGFTSPEAKYNVGAIHPQYGAALLTDVVPQDHAQQGLRIELDEPTFVRTEIPSFDSAFKDAGWEFVSLALAPEPPASAAKQALANTPTDATTPASASAPAAAEASEGAPPSGAPEVSGSATNSAGGPAGAGTEPRVPKVMFDLKREPGGSERDVGMARWGPLPAGRRYTVSRVSYSREQFCTSTLFARTVAVAPGQTLNVQLKADGDIAMSGKVTGADEQPLPGVNLMLHVGDDLLIGAISGKDGEYELRGVPAGKHTLELLRRAAPSGFG
jgi:hypothetical protein